MKVELYTSSWCPFCIRAKQILDNRQVTYTEFVMDGKDAELNEVKQKYGHSTVPIVVIDDELVGGCDELQALDAAGKLG